MNTHYNSFLVALSAIIALLFVADVGAQVSCDYYETIGKRIVDKFESLGYDFVLDDGTETTVTGRKKFDDMTYEDVIFVLNHDEGKLVSFQISNSDGESPILSFKDPCNAFDEVEEFYSNYVGAEVSCDFETIEKSISDYFESYGYNCFLDGFDTATCKKDFDDGTYQDVFLVSNPAEGKLVSFQITTPEGTSPILYFKDPCNAFDEMEEFYWDYFYPPNVCDYEAVSKDVITLLNGFFMGDQYCSEDAKTNAESIYYRCESQYMYAEYEAIKQPYSFGGVDAPVPYKILAGPSKDDTAELWFNDDPCDAVNDVWEKLVEEINYGYPWFSDMPLYNMDATAALAYFQNNANWFNVLSKDAEGEDSVAEDVDVVAPDMEDDESNDEKETEEDSDVAAMDSSAPVSRISSTGVGAAATAIAFGAIML